MHGVREELLRAQARALALPLVRVPIPAPCTNEEYQARFLAALEAERGYEVTGVAFGDLFLQDVRKYRERLMAKARMEAHFPLWGRPTRELGRGDGRFRGPGDSDLHRSAPRVRGSSRAGRSIGTCCASCRRAIDPCGENGEFHTFTYAGPAFPEEIEVVRGRVVEREGFLFTEVLPKEGET